MEPTIPKISFQTIVVWFAFIVLVGGLGTYFAYNGAMATDAWRYWTTPQAWKIDLLRIIVAALVTIYIFWRLGGLHRGRFNLEELRAFIPSGRHERALFVVFMLMFWSAVLYFLPESFEDIMYDKCNFVEDGPLAGKEKLAKVSEELRKNVPRNGVYFNTEIDRPAIPYTIYRICFWFGAVWLMCICILRAARNDWSLRSRSISEFCQRLPLKPLTEEDATIRVFDVMVTGFHMRTRGLRERAQRYLSILLILVLCLVYENVTSSHGTMLPESLEVAKLAVWVLLGPVLIIFLVVVISGYHRSLERVRHVVDQFIEILTNSGTDSGLLDKARNFDEELITSKNGFSFLTSVMKSSNIAIPLLLSVMGYFVQTLTDGQWIDILVPTILVDFVKDIYVG